MVEHVESRRKWDSLVQSLSESGILRSPQVIRAFRQVPRESFIPEGMRAYAAVDSPLSIGYGQTISAPLS
jgi:protein-L-isoaspartate(D-aspartate) O-methyltransferase